MLLLYECGTRGATFSELESWAQPTMRKNLRSTLRRLVEDRAFVHDDGHRFYSTKLGAREVEEKNLHGAKNKAS